MLIGHAAPQDSCLRLVGRTKVSWQLGMLSQFYPFLAGEVWAIHLGNQDSMFISFLQSSKGQPVDPPWPYHEHPVTSSNPITYITGLFEFSIVHLLKEPLGPMFPTTCGPPGGPLSQLPRLSSTRSFRAQQLPQYLTAMGKIFRELLPVGGTGPRRGVGFLC